MKLDMKSCPIGRDDNGKPRVVLLERLIETRLLIQANSGGGKSYAIRKIIEETHGQCQQIILDVEGEFSTLREKFDFVIAGKGHDIPAEPRSADLLARKILELGTSLIVDLYELKQFDRIKFVKNFLDAMINAPKELWHPVMVVLDEAHLFAPEKGHSEAMQAVTDLAARGRKRGYCAVLATQRLSKLNKDVAAELGNKLIGRTGLDIDMKRAADELGFSSKEQFMSLRKLRPGEFYVFGPAISDEVTKLKIGEVKTSHPLVGARMMHTPPPPDKIKGVLAKLVDIPKEAEEEIRDRETLRLKIRELEKKLREIPQPKPTDAQKQQWIQAGRTRATKEIKLAMNVLDEAMTTFKNAVLVSEFNQVAEDLKEINKGIEKMHEELNRHTNNVHSPWMPPSSPPTVPSNHQALHAAIQRGKTLANTVSVTKNVTKINYERQESDSRNLGRCERKILGFLKSKSEMPGQTMWMTKVQIGAMTGYAHSSGGFNNAISKLIQAGLILREGGRYRISEEGQQVDVSGVPHSLRDWMNKLGRCERAIYETLDHTGPIEKGEVAHMTAYSAGSGGFNNAISRLITLGLVKRYSDGRIGINEELLNL